MGWCGFSFVHDYNFILRTTVLGKVKERLQPNGETVNMRRGICDKFMLPEKYKITADEKEASGIICNAMDILYVLEMNLASYAWYKQGEPFPVNDPISIAAVRKSVTVLLNSIKEFTLCNHGNGWKLQKYHGILHLPVDIYIWKSTKLQ